MKKLVRANPTHVPIKTQIEAAIKQTKAAGFKVNRKQIKEAIRIERAAELWTNDVYTVIWRQGKLADEFLHPSVMSEWRGKCGYLSIRRNDREPCDNWRDFQEIKNQLAGPDREAVQLYPAEERLVDTANQYHLWVIPKDMAFPMGFFTDRVVSSVSTNHNGIETKQSNR